MNKPKILLWDIESSHNLVLSFDLYPDNIPHDNIIIERHIYCIAYRWYGEKKTHVISILDDPIRFTKDNHDDYHVVSEFRKVMEQADAQVAHYGNKFDMPMLNARLAINGLKPLPKIISLDTKNIASKYFRFNCNRLDYLAKLLGHEGKLENPKDLWIKCFKGNIKALKHMAKYNKQDIDALYFVFEKLMPYMKNNPLNMCMFMKGARCVNPSCGSTNIEWRGFNYTRVNKYRRFVCRACGSWSDERHAFQKEDKSVPLVKQQYENYNKR